MFYHRKLSKYKYKLDSFKEILAFASSSAAQWKKGIDQNGVVWNIEELPLEYSSFSVLKEIYEALNLNFKRPSFFLSRVPLSGLGNHVDHRKWGNLGFPLTSGFGLSKINFHDPFNQIVEELVINEPINGQYIPFIINTRMTHSVVYEQQPVRERITLMHDLFEWPGHIFEKVDNGTLFKSDPSIFI